MEIVKVIQVIFSSKKSFDDAVIHCIDLVSKTTHILTFLY
jgi:flavin-binding protein dodecin